VEAYFAFSGLDFEVRDFPAGTASIATTTTTTTPSTTSRLGLVATAVACITFGFSGRSLGLIAVVFGACLVFFAHACAG